MRNRAVLTRTLATTAPPRPIKWFEQVIKTRKMIGVVVLAAVVVLVARRWRVRRCRRLNGGVRSGSTLRGGWGGTE